jgi:regulator of replication initiation timing
MSDRETEIAELACQTMMDRLKPELDKKDERIAALTAERNQALDSNANFLSENSRLLLENARLKELLDEERIITAMQRAALDKETT